MKLTPRLAAQNLLRKHPMPLCIVLCGLPGSGKSFFLKVLKSEMTDEELVTVDTDSYIEAEARKLGKTYSEVYKSVNFKDAKRHMNGTMTAALTKGQNVIIDQTNVSSKARIGKMATVPKFYTKVCVVLDVDDKIREERLKLRNLTEGKFIPPGVVVDMAKSWVPPSKLEGYAEIITVNNNPVMVVKDPEYA